jgi:hypothetical protein
MVALRSVRGVLRNSPQLVPTALYHVQKPMSSCVVPPQVEPERSSTGRPNLSLIARRQVSLFDIQYWTSFERRAGELPVSAAISRFPEVEMGEFRNTRDTLFARGWVNDRAHRLIVLRRHRLLHANSS